MATRTLALTVLATSYAQDLVSQINRTCVALRTLPIVVGEGPNCSFVAKGSGSTSAAMSEGAAAGTPSNDIQLPATLQWARYKNDGGATGPAQAAAAGASSPRGNATLLANDVVDSLASVASKINADIYAGDGAASPKQITGLDQAIGDTTNTYATIARGSYSWFKPNVFNPTVATPFTLAQARSDISKIKVACGEAPNLALCNPDVFTSITSAFDPSRQYVQQVEFTDSRRGVVKLDASVNAVNINGCTFIEDKDAPLESAGDSGKIYYLNTRFVEMRVQVQAEIAAMLKAMGIVPGQVLRANDGFGEVPLLAVVAAMAKVGDADTFMTKVYGELVVTKPSACGVRRYVAIGS
jgi:hypothetical protein